MKHKAHEVYFVSLFTYSSVSLLAKQQKPKNQMLTFFAGLVLLNGFSSNLSYGSVLTFDQFRNASGTVVPTISGNGPEADYGDRITGSPMDVPGGQFTYGNRGEGFTPNVTVDFFAGNATQNNQGVSQWNDRYGDLINVLIADNNSSSLNVRFTSDTGFNVQLYSFDIAGWPSADYTIKSVTLSDGSSNLFSQNNVLVEGDANGPKHSAFEFATPLNGSDLLLQIDYSNLSGGLHDNIGIDNIRFGQNPHAAVPLPGAAFLFFSSLSAFALGMRLISSRQKQKENKF